MIERLVLRFLRWRNGRRHRRCLARIEELERELFPELFKLRAILPPKREWLEDLAIAPGARWLCDDVKDIQPYDGTYLALRVRAQNYTQLVPNLWPEVCSRGLVSSGIAVEIAQHKRAFERAHLYALK